MVEMVDRNLWSYLSLKSVQSKSSPLSCTDLRQVIASLFTFAITIHGIVRHLAHYSYKSGSKIRTVIRVGCDAGLFLLWIAAATLLLRYPKDCSRVIDGFCFQPKNDSVEFKDLGNQPVTTWDVAIAFSFVEM